MNQPQPGRPPDLPVSSRHGRKAARRLPLLLALQAALAAPLALAAPAGQDRDPAAQAATTLDHVVVTATRQADDALVVPAAVDVVTGRDIRLAQPGINLSESVQRIPGVVARDRQNHAQDQQISIRGFGARATFGVRGIRMFTDGIPATMPDGQGQVSHFLFDAADRVEVLRGPFSALYGNASGGVISLFTADAPADPLLRGEYIAGSDGLRRASASYRAPWASGDHGSFLFDLVDLDTDGYRDHSKASRRQGQALLKGTLASGGHYTLLANAIDLKAQDPQGLSRDQLDGDRRAASDGALQFDTRKTVRQDQLGLNLEQPLGGGHGLAFTAYTGSRETTQMLAIPVFVQERPLHGGGAIDLDRGYYGGDLRWRWEGAWLDRPFSLTAGYSHEVSDERRLGYENFIGDTVGVVGALRRDEDNAVTGRDVYVQADWAPAQRWRINVGARHSRVGFESDDRFVTDANPDDSGRLEYSRTSPVAGVLFRATPTLSVYANAGAGFETPTFAELAYRSDGLSGLNDTLAPARSRNYEFGLRGRTGALDYSAALFHSRTADELVVAANQGGRSVYANAETTRRQGLELAVSGELAPAWRFATAYTFLDAEYVDDFALCGAPPCASDDLIIEGGRNIPGLSRHFAWGQLRWSPLADTDVMFEGRFSDRVWVDDSNTESAPAYASFDLAAERRFRLGGLEWRGFARINNLFDRDVIGSVIVNEGNGRFYEPAPGRNWMVGLEIGYVLD
ncbi:TonB-dependent receptor [Lysobacter sp. GX 14042]|uniref:TonB-dependent receptor family protein n=1 Tax=Lysobacter sp. GX 14042 TaxID=2907155 RepID=UPI001F39E1B6|nr:TonB-dependent receptor [Lysobacter sp. GX 14042]MCE7031551.1 TonB-dependent receptor [Lysobacter sp. GX 14042]